MDGKKIIDKYENPFDIYLIYMAYLNPPLIIWLGMGIFAVTSGLISFAKDAFKWPDFSEKTL